MVKRVSPKPLTIAVYGGTFDPFHRGHEAICNAVLAHDNVDQLRIIPCFQPALKPGASASADQRLTMLSHWQASHSMRDRIVVDSIEMDRQGPSYTIETLQALKRQWPNSRLLFVLGTDAWNSLPHWHQYENLAGETSFWVFLRQGESAAIEHNGLKRFTNFEQLVVSNNAGYWLDSSVQLPISSSDIRAQRNMAPSLMPDSVSDYIKKVGLYQHGSVEPQVGNE